MFGSVSGFVMLKPDNPNQTEPVRFRNKKNIFYPLTQQVVHVAAPSL
jgi:hypothetical protein